MLLRIDLLEAKINGVLSAVYGTYGSLTYDKKHFEKVEKKKDEWLKELESAYGTMLRELMEVVKNDKDR